MSGKTMTELLLYNGTLEVAAQIADAEAIRFEIAAKSGGPFQHERGEIAASARRIAESIRGKRMPYSSEAAG